MKNILKFTSIVAVLLGVLIFQGKADAEQPAAEQYRQMFKSGNFYVEYQMSRYYGNDKYRYDTPLITLAGKNGQRMERETKAKGSSVNAPVQNFLKQELASVYGRVNGLRTVRFETFSTKSWPNVLYRNGKYYRFDTFGNRVGGLFSFVGTKNVTGLVLSEEELESPYLEPNEEWRFVKEDLALPDELALFWPEDPFRENFLDTAAPKYESSSKVTVKDKVYDCDRYVNDLKNLANTIIAREAYDMLYDKGQLVMINRYLIRNGQEKLVRKTKIKTITASVPDNAFAIGKQIKVYAAGTGDMKDLIEERVLAETVGGN